MKKSFYISLFLIFFFSSPSWGQTYPQAILSDGLIGFKDTAGKYIVSPKYSLIGQFDENGLCKVAVGGGYAYREVPNIDSSWTIGGYLIDLRQQIYFDGGLYGYVNSRIEEIIPPIYRVLGDFSDDVALFVNDRGYGYISSSGEVLIDGCTYTKEFHNGVGEVLKDGLKGLIDNKGNMLIDFKYSDIVPQWEDNVLWVNNGGVWKTSEDSSSIFVEGGKWGLCDMKGNELSRFIFDCVGNYRDGSAYIGVVRDGKYLYGVIDANGKVVVAPKYEAVGDCYSEGMMKVCSLGKWGLIDVSGNEIIPCKYELISDVKNGFVSIASKVGKNNVIKWGFADISGKVISECKYDRVGEISEGMAAVCIDNLWGYIDSTGKLIVSPKYVKAKPFSEKRAVVRDAKTYLYGYINNMGEQVTDMKYTTAKSFSEGLAAVSLVNKKGYNGAWNDFFGYIDIDGKEAIPFIYNEACSFQDGMAEVVVTHLCPKRVGNKMILVDHKKGKIDHQGYFTLSGGSLFSLDDIIPENSWAY